MAYANNKGTDQSAHPQSDQRLCCSLPIWHYTQVAISKIPRFLLAFVPEQTGLSLTCSHISEDRFSHDLAHHFICGYWNIIWAVNIISSNGMTKALTETVYPRKKKKKYGRQWDL